MKFLAPFFIFFISILSAEETSTINFKIQSGISEKGIEVWVREDKTTPIVTLQAAIEGAPVIAIKQHGGSLNLLATMIVYKDVPPLKARSYSGATVVTPEQVTVGQIPARTVPTTEQVVEEVARRIEAKKADAEKKNKFMK